MSISRPDMPAVTFPGGCDVQLISERAKLEADAGANSAAAKASGSRKTGTQNCHMTPQPCFGGSTQRNGTQGLEQTLAPSIPSSTLRKGPGLGAARVSRDRWTDKQMAVCVCICVHPHKNVTQP